MNVSNYYYEKTLAQKQTITGHRSPTKYEIKFGEGAIHYRDFDYDEWLKVDGCTLKVWIVANDGLRYYR